MTPASSARRPPDLRSRRARAALLGLVLLVCSPLRADPSSTWAERLQADLERVDARHRADLGVYVLDLASGQSAAYRADETWYLASTVKLPVAMAVLRGVERGEYTLATTLTLRAADVVDGAGDTNRHAPGAPLSIRFLLEQMMVRSDNTASDMLIGLVGIQAVNGLVQSLVPWGFQPITSLADVRRHVYSQLDPAALRLSGKDFLLLKAQRTDLAQRHLLARLLHTRVEDFRLATVGQAYDAYYAGGLNSARLDAYGDLLVQLARGKALNPTHTAYLLDVMLRSTTGPQRIQAGLPPEARFAHKTGTQHARTCDSGIVGLPRPGQRDQQVVVVACTRGEPSLAASERALREVGEAVCRSGPFNPTKGLAGPLSGNSHEPVCRVDPRPERLGLDLDAVRPGPGAGGGMER